ncbi:hypothetical protein HBI13_014260 [Parastagonospora nodorum]|nr:hypothetical protein HBI10_083890 [Parastagonospora nodorum]KAH4031692.1 hypothetical protein HBI13_014260 [Parastagonospora nodorum]KAH6085186.1 hypothetical protein HBI65_193790 [Parastagonospora nodorum]KAH6417339.1 hypothetical protein HBI14_107450 [Parastagonospora nodorum]
MFTAGHNVYSWRRTNGRLPGRAREIKAYAGYNGAKSISDASVEFRRATRVVTTSQWLDSARSRPRDFALVQFDRPFTDVTPFQYIETPAAADAQLGVVGYPADLKDQETGERGSKMGGNSGGPVLRRNDLVALGTHVYGGGDFDTASVFGRYGNPIQDYIGALEVPLAIPGQINMVTVGSAYVHQDNAATGPQTKEIAKLGVNVVAQPSGNGTNKPEFWIFEGAEEVLKLATDLAGALGRPIAGIVGTAIAPIIAQGLAGANSLDVNAALRRFMLVNKTLLMAESNFKEEGFFDDLAGAVTGALKIMPIGSPVIGLPFQEIMKGINVVGDAADKLVNDVANEIARGILIRAQSVQMRARAESAMDVDGKQDSASANEKAFLEELARAAKAHKSAQSGGAQPDGWFDDAFNSIKDAAGTVVDIGSSVVDTAVNVGKDVGNAVDNVGNRISNGILDIASGVADDVGNGINGVAENLNNGANRIIGT